MASSKIRPRALWLQVHKWIGIALALLIVPISLTGAALVWHDWLDETLNPQRYPQAGSAALPASAYAAAALRSARPGEQLATIVFPREAGSVQATLVKPNPSGGRPQRAWVWMDPRDAKVIERAGAGEGLVRVLHVLHGSLMVPGVGRQIVGWVGVAMLLSSLTGLWLWWPLQGGFVRGLRWRRRPQLDANLHHQAGFWIAVPLAMLSFTGVWISFPAFFSPPSGTAAAGPRGGGGAPLPATRLGPDGAMASAQKRESGSLVSLSWPTTLAPEWTASFARTGGAPAEVKVDDVTGVARPVAPKPETLARTMRRLHDGTGMGVVWQTIIFIGGILPALLAVTGITMWLRVRRRRRKAAPLQKALA
jgi:uncharacterized iron-regulated membrane protein